MKRRDGGVLRDEPYDRVPAGRNRGAQFRDRGKLKSEQEGGDSLYLIDI